MPQTNLSSRHIEPENITVRLLMKSDMADAIIHLGTALQSKSVDVFARWFTYDECTLRCFLEIVVAGSL